MQSQAAAHILLALFSLLTLVSVAHAECTWALWAYQTNRVGVDVVRDLLRVLTTQDECRAHGAGWAEKMREQFAANRNDPASKDLSWSWNCTSIPEPLMKDTSRHPVAVPR